MSSSTAKNHSAYIKKILLAGSQEEVKQDLDVTINALSAKNKGADNIESFIAELTDELELLSPMNKDAGQWSNIHMARVHLHQMRKKS